MFTLHRETEVVVPILLGGGGGEAIILLHGQFVGKGSDVAKGRIWLRENLGNLASRKRPLWGAQVSFLAVMAIVTELHASCTQTQETSG